MKTSAEKMIKYFGLKVENAEQADTSREIVSPSLNRAGLQLGGLEVNDFYRSTVVAWGSQEKYFFKSLSNAKRYDVIKKAISSKTPAIFLSKKFLEEDELKKQIIEEANKQKVPVILLERRVTDAVGPFAAWFEDNDDKPKSIHGSLAIINGIGVIITGPSGIGKSEAILELIHNEHLFVSDDTVELFKIGDTLYGRPSSITKDLLEARGIGLVNIPLIYGRKSTVSRAKVELEIQLVPEKEMNKVDRLGIKNLKTTYLNKTVPIIQIPTGSGRSVAVLIEAATNVYLARRSGVDPMAMIKERTKNIKTKGKT